MAALNFPNSPSTNDLHTENGVTFKWNGTIWKKVGSAYTDATNLNVTGISTVGSITGVAATFTGNVQIGGVLTYEDVKNVDSVGIITAREGVFLPDTKELKIGNTAASPDLKLYSTGTNGWVYTQQSGADLYMGTNAGEVYIQTGASGNDTAIKVNSGGAVELNFGTTKKLETYSSGVAISGDASSAILRWNDTDGNVNYQIAGYDGNRMIIMDGTGGTVLDLREDGTNIFCKNSLRLDVDNLEVSLGAGTDFKLFHTGSLNVFDASTSNPFVFRFGGTEKVRINSAGTVRIKRAVSTSLGNDSIFLAIGDTENGTNVNRMIGFGYNSNFGTSVYPASMGYTETDNSGNTKGALTFNTRNTTGATDAPVERFRISSGGGHSIWNDTGYYAGNLTECNTDHLPLNIRKTRNGHTKGIAFGPIGSASLTTIQGYDTSDNSANNLTLNPLGGQVVINTSSPVSGNNYATVHVGGDASSSGGGNVLIGNLYNSGLKNPKNCQLTLAGQHNSTGYNADGQVKLYITGSDNDSGVNYPLFMENENAQVQMVGRQNGTDFGVGIGSATPATALDVCASAPEIRMTNTATSRSYFSWYNHYGGVKKNADISYNEGNANWEFKLYRADSQANSPYGNIQFFTGSTSSPTLAMNITRPGSVTMPKQPCCVMYASSATTWSSGWTKIPLNNTRYDVGNNFDSSNNRYSIPVTGKYAIGYNVEINIGSGQTWIYLVPRINRNDTTSTNAGINYADFAPTSNNSSNHYYCHQGHWIASLSQGDTVTWETHGAGNAWTIANNNQSHYYIYQVA